MKKIVSLLLAVLMIFSITATAAFAADDASKPIKITFLDDRGYLLKEITVDYGEDYTSKAPTDTYVDEGYKYSIFGWNSDLPAFKNTVLVNLPAFVEGDGITEVTYTAVYDAEPFTPENVIEDVVDGIFGESTTNIFSSFIQLIKEFFQQLLMYIMNFGM